MNNKKIIGKMKIFDFINTFAGLLFITSILILKFSSMANWLFTKPLNVKVPE